MGIDILEIFQLVWFLTKWLITILLVCLVFVLCIGLVAAGIAGLVVLFANMAFAAAYIVALKGCFIFAGIILLMVLFSTF
jgi:hypothetical protein